MKFIHISDTHFHRHKRDNKAAAKLLKTIKSRYPEHYLIVTGDITDDGAEEQYKEAYFNLKQFQDRIFMCPGNHDFGAVGFVFEPERARRFDEMLAAPLGQGGSFFGSNAPVVNVVKEGEERVLLVALDSNLETDTPFDFACGEIGEKQLKALDPILCNPDSQDMTKMLFYHHHPFIRNDPFMELKDAREMWAAIYMKVDVLLFGHRHVSEMWENKNGVEYILASDNSPGKDWVREITVEQHVITVADVSIA